MRRLFESFGFLACLLLVGSTACAQREPAGIDADSVDAADGLIGLDFSTAERELMLGELSNHRSAYEALRAVDLGNGLAPAQRFEAQPSACAATDPPTIEIGELDVAAPRNLDELAFMSIGELAPLIRSRTVSAVEVARAFINRLQAHDAALSAVVTLTEERALEQAAQLDRELAEGRYRGALHGIPYGAKDLFAVEGYPTTWGAVPYRDQIRPETASVIRRLDAAGAVLVAKLSLGALAWGDVWFGGQTRNPWDLARGSSGSSAGSAAAVSAGLVPFALGTETWGSIVSPASEVGVTGLRPTFGRVSRHGAMALAWSMDKVGALCRNAADCGTVLAVIGGCDGIDASVTAAPYTHPVDVALASLRIGYLEADFGRTYEGRAQDLATLDELRALGARLVPIALPDLPIAPLAFVLSAEAAAAFDELTRSGSDDLLVRQVENAWPNVFRAARLIPAVEYIQANRVRALLAAEMDERFERVDLYVAPAREGDNLLLTNLTGHPAIVVPNGLAEDGTPTSITFIGRPFEEALLVAVADLYQQATGHHELHPPQFIPEPP